MGEGKTAAAPCREQQSVVQLRPSPGAVLNYRGRLLIIQGLTVAASSHLPALREHLAEAALLGWWSGLVVVLCVSLIVPLCFSDTPLVYWLTTVLCSAAIVAYLASRLVPFPQLASVGDRYEPWELVAVLSEAFTISTALLALLSAHSDENMAQ